MYNKDKVLPANTTKATKAMVIKHEDKFVKIFGTLHCKLNNNNTAPKFPSRGNLKPSCVTTETSVTPKPANFTISSRCATGGQP